MKKKKSAAGGIFVNLMRQMESSHAIIVLKSEMLFHYIFRDGKTFSLDKWHALQLRNLRYHGRNSRGT